MDGMETVEASWVEERCPRKDFSSFSMCFYSFLCWLLLLIRMMAWIGRWMSLWFLLYLSNATRCLLSLSCLFSFFGIFFSVWKSRDTSHNHALSSTHTHTKKACSWEEVDGRVSVVSHRLGFLLLSLSFFRFTMKVTDYHDTLYQPNLVDDDEKENLIPKMHNISRVKIQRVINEDETSLSNVQHFVGFSFIL